MNPADSSLSTAQILTLERHYLILMLAAWNPTLSHDRLPLEFQLSGLLTNELKMVASQVLLNFQIWGLLEYLPFLSVGLDDVIEQCCDLGLIESLTLFGPRSMSARPFGAIFWQGLAVLPGVYAGRNDE